MKIAVVGGGITGLTVAHEITKKGNRVILFEAENELGGLSRSVKEKEWSWPLEGFFHHFFTSDNEVKKLLKELGLRDKLFYKNVKTSVYLNGSIYPFDSAFDLLRFPHLKLIDKLRMGSVIFVLRQLPFLPGFEKSAAQELFPRLIGPESWELIWQRMMEGKFKELAGEVSFSWLWARIKKRSKYLGYINGGSAVIFKAIKEKIKAQEGSIFLNSSVLEVMPSDGRWKIKTKNKNFLFDRVVFAVPLERAIEIVGKNIPEDKINDWKRLETIGALTLILRMKNKFLPGDTYWLNILEKEFPFIALVEQTNFISPENYGGEHLVYAGGYYRQDDPLLTWIDDRVLGHFAPYLRRLNPSFERFLIDFRVFSSPYAQPVIPTNYSQVIPPLELIPGNLYWATANHIYPWDRGTNFSVKLGKRIARLV